MTETITYKNFEEFYLKNDALYQIVQQLDQQYISYISEKSFFRQLLVYHQIYLNYEGKTYSSHSGLIQFVPSGQFPATKSRCYQLKDIQIEFQDYNNAVYDIYIHPHQLLSILFMGTGYDQNVSLFVELSDIGDLVTYYCTQQQYNTFDCFNQSDLFVNNIIMSGLIPKQLNNDLSFNDMFLFNLLSQSIYETDFSQTHEICIKYENPTPRSEYEIDIIPAIPCIGRNFLIQNLFKINIYPILCQISAMIQTDIINDKTGFYKVRDMNITKQSESYIEYIISQYNKYVNLQQMAEIKDSFSDLRPGHYHYIRELKHALVQYHSYNQINTEQQIFIQYLQPYQSYSGLQYIEQKQHIHQINKIINPDSPDQIHNNASLQNMLNFGIWILFNKGYNSSYNLKKQILKMQQIYNFDIFNVFSIFLYKQFTHVNNVTVYDFDLQFNSDGSQTKPKEYIEL